MAEKPKETPHEAVSSKCIAYSEALLNHRRSSLTNADARKQGTNLFSWFKSKGALTEDNETIACRCIDLGITILKTSHDTYQAVEGEIKEAYTTYSQR
jgi:hypothetical protein